MCERLYDCWLSQRVEWHVERGLKINMDGTAAHDGGLTKDQLMCMLPASRKGVAKETKMQTFCVSCFRPGTLTAHMASSGGAAHRHSFAHEVHTF